MNGQKVLVISSARGLSRTAKRALVSAGYEVDACALEPETLESRLKEPVDLCIFDADSDFKDLCRALERLADEQPSCGALMVTRDLNNHHVLEQILDRGLNNVIAKHGGVSASQDRIDETELIATVEKLLTKDIFGIEKYLPPRGIRLHEQTIERSTARAGALTDLEEFLAAIDCYSRIQPMVLAVADELLMNAIFSAPRAPDGTAKYEELDRREDFILEPSEVVGFRYACDGRNVYISVADCFGSLNRDMIVKYLGRGLMGQKGQVEQKKGGAGLGLYMVVHNITQLVFNIQKEKRTEIIASFYVRGGLRAFRASGQSLNLFMIE